MPELPEVETVVRGLREQLVQKEIVDVAVYFERMVQYDVPYFKKQVLHKHIIDVERFGKYILIILEDKTTIRIHLRMEGKFFLTTNKIDATIDKHVHIVFSFSDQNYLKYHDVRKFGTFEIVTYQTDWHQDKKFQELGYEPWETELTPLYLFKQMQRSTRMIKPFLLDQKTIVGLGNIYVDEVLFLAKIHPETRANKLSKKDATKILEASKVVLKKAIALGGSTIRTYHNTLGIDGMFQNELNVHLQKDKPCPTCGRLIEKIKVGGRGTYFCAKCQKLKK